MRNRLKVAHNTAGVLRNVLAGALIRKNKVSTLSSAIFLVLKGALGYMSKQLGNVVSRTQPAFLLGISKGVPIRFTVLDASALSKALGLSQAPGASSTISFLSGKLDCSPKN